MQNNHRSSSIASNSSALTTTDPGSAISALLGFIKGNQMENPTSLEPEKKKQKQSQEPSKSPLIKIDYYGVSISSSLSSSKYLSGTSENASLSSIRKEIREMNEARTLQKQRNFNTMRDFHRTVTVLERDFEGLKFDERSHSIKDNPIEILAKHQNSVIKSSKVATNAQDTPVISGAIKTPLVVKKAINDVSPVPDVIQLDFDFNKQSESTPAVGASTAISKRSEFSTETKTDSNKFASIFKSGEFVTPIKTNYINQNVSEEDLHHSKESYRAFLESVLKRETAKESGDDQLLQKEVNEFNLNKKLTEEEERMVNNAFQKGPATEVLVNKFSVEITRAHAVLLKPECWLSDEVINFYMELLRSRSLRCCGWVKTQDEACTMGSTAKPENYKAKGTRFWERKPCYFHKSHFYTKLYENDIFSFENVKTWTTKRRGKADLFEHALVFFPINCNNVHWCLAYADMENKTITYLDSMGGRGTQVLMNLLEYLDCEHKDKKKTPLPDKESWRMISPGKKGIPQQDNGSDCGVFTCIFANFLSIGCDIKNIKASDMVNWRKRILTEIIKSEADGAN